MRTPVVVRLLLFSFVLLAFSHGAFAQVGISVGFGPPAIPLYAQPICPADGYLWVPGYWSYDVAYGYYWVPGTWVQPPQVGLLWTPGYWGWGGSNFIFYPGYWGPQPSAALRRNPAADIDQSFRSLLNSTLDGSNVGVDICAALTIDRCVKNGKNLKPIW